jgi:HEPN domain-containing protein
MPTGPDAKNPQVWLNYAQADFQLAEPLSTDTELMRQLRCFHLQQAAEKSIKAVLTQRGSIFPFTNNLDILISLIKGAGIPWDPTLDGAIWLNRYASARLYPGLVEPVSLADYQNGKAIAHAVYTWAKHLIHPQSSGS